MVSFEFNDHEIDECMTCKGTWIDHDELALLGAKDHIDTFMSQLAPYSRGQLRCPICKKKMQAGFIGEIELDNCPAGHGLWFDSGEVAAIVTGPLCQSWPSLQASLGDIFAISIHTD